MRRQSGFLERDRAAVLTLRSAVKGVVDYSQVDIHNPMWWKQWRFRIKAMSDVEYGDLLQQAYNFELALVSNGRISTEDFSAVQREAKEIFKDIEGNLKPWLGRTKEDRQVRESREFKQQWEEVAGFSLDDREAMRQWEKDIKRHTNTAQQTLLAAEQEKLERQNSFHEIVDRVRKKRLKQQGRG